MEEEATTITVQATLTLPPEYNNHALLCTIPSNITLGR